MCDHGSSRSSELRRRDFLGLMGGATLGLVAGTALAAPTQTPPKPMNVLTPDAALDRLMAGNQRYVEGVAKRHDFKSEREPLTRGQNPFAAILSCADSRIAPEYAFDSARGDLFVCRVAGNLVNDDVLASLEYAVSVLKTPLILVLGHQACGAVDAAIQSVTGGTTLPGHLPSLVRAIEPAVKAASGQPGDRLANTISENVRHAVAVIRSTAPILGPAFGAGTVRVEGAVYDLSNGQVTPVK